MKNLSEISQMTLYGNALLDWGIALAVAVVVLFGLYLTRIVAVARLKVLADRFCLAWAGYFLRALLETKLLFLILVAMCAASMVLDVSEKAEVYIGRVFSFSLFIQGGIWIVAFYDSWYEAYRKRNLTKNPSAVTTLGAARFLISIITWICILVLILDNLGFNVTALVAGLGVTGIAVALAVQNILGDLLASLSIIMDRTFVVGDFLVLSDQHMGTVENIGLKATRIRSVSGEQMIFSNSDLLSSRIRNFGRMQERRALMRIAVTYATPLEKLERIPEILRHIIETQKSTRFSRAHFVAYMPHGLDFEYVYFVLSSDYNLYMDIQQAINLEILKRFAAEGIDFAYPTQTVFVERSSHEPRRNDDHQPGERRG